MMDSDISIRRAEIQDLTSIKRLADNNRTTLGFVLRPALMAGIKQGWLLIAEQTNGELLGFIHYRHRRDMQTTLYEICVAQSFRRRGVGRALIEALARESAQLRKACIQLRAPVGIPANAFYQMTGFALDRTESGRKSPLNVWRYPICHREDD